MVEEVVQISGTAGGPGMSHSRSLTIHPWKNDGTGRRSGFRLEILPILRCLLLVSGSATYNSPEKEVK